MYLQRTWCLKEIVDTIKSKIDFKLFMCPADEKDFINNGLLKDVNGLLGISIYTCSLKHLQLKI